MVVFWRIVRVLLWPLRMFGLGTDAYTLWSYREQIVTVVSALFGAIATTILAVAQRYPPWVVPLFLLAGFIGVLALVGWTVKGLHYLKARRGPTAQRSEPYTANIGRIDTAYFGEVLAIRADKQRQEQNTERLATDEKRRTLKNALSVAADEGEQLLEMDDLTNEQAHDWAIRVGIMIALALDQGEWRLYFSGHALAPAAIQDGSEARQLVSRRLQRLHDLVLRIDRDKLQVRSDFHSRDWIATRPPRILIPPQAQKVLTRAKEVAEARDQQ